VDAWLIYDAIVLLYVVVIVAIGWRQRRLRREVAASRTWSSTASRVVEARMDEIVATKGGTTYIPRVVYDYTVDGRALRGQRPHFGDPVGFSFRRNADRRLKALADAAAVQIYYDPADPTRAVIERGAPILRRHGVLLAILVIVLLGLLVAPALFPFL
jgi:hypothetical protein